MRIWVTRAAPEAEATARRLRAGGHAPLIAPVLEVRHLDGPAPDLDGVGALAFTSRNGVRAFAALSPERRLPAFTVGRATARAARDLGFTDVICANGDAAALAALIAQQRTEGEVLHAAPEIPAADLPAALAERGIRARAHVVYKTEALALGAAAAAALKSDPPEIDAVLVHSPRAAARLAGLVELQKAAARIEAYCISEAAAEPLQGLNFKALRWAPVPDETSLLGLLA